MRRRSASGALGALAQDCLEGAVGQLDWIEIRRDLADWVTMEAKRQQASDAKFYSDRDIPDPSLLAFAKFPEFISERRKLLGQRIRTLL
jgi:hypothetical protein